MSISGIMFSLRHWLKITTQSKYDKNIKEIKYLFVFPKKVCSHLDGRRKLDSDNNFVGIEPVCTMFYFRCY